MFKAAATLSAMTRVVVRGPAPAARYAGPRNAVRLVSKVSESEKSFQQKSRADDVELKEWEKRDRALRKRYGAWNPSKKLSRQHMQSIRDLAELMPSMKTIDIANHFQVSPEAIRRILKSSWVPNDNEEDKVLKREERRKEQRKKYHEEMKEQRKTETQRAAPSDATAQRRKERHVKPVASQKIKRHRNKNARDYDIERIID